jgi:uncharacterized membrane protein
MDTAKESNVATSTTVATETKIETKGVQPVFHTDAVLYICIGVFGSLVAAFSSDTAEKLMSPGYLFIARTFCEAILAGAGSLKMVRYGNPPKT